MLIVAWGESVFSVETFNFILNYFLVFGFKRIILMKNYLKKDSK